MKRLIYSLILFAVFAMALNAQSLKTAPMFTNHMIIQQDVIVPVYGTAKAGTKITVKFNGKTLQTVTDKHGNWKVFLPKQKASFTGKSMHISSGAEMIKLDDIVVGEVWIAGGQSNMQYTMQLKPGHQKPYKGEDLCELELKKPANPNIRIFNCKKNSANAHWDVANGESLAQASALGYFCVKHLQDSLDVPVGVISTAIGGTFIEQWFVDGECYNQMVRDYVPFPVKGFLWYQGEQNCTKADHDYVQKFKRLTNEWKQAYNGASKVDAPFLTVMLAPFRYSSQKHRAGYVDAEELAKFRLQQMECIDSVPNTEIIFTPDLVDDLYDIHPSYKWEVGRRMSTLALNKVYGHTQLEWSGPRADSTAVIAGEDFDTIKVHFSHVADGIVNPESVKKYKYGAAYEWFEVCGNDGIWHSATAIYYDKENIKVWCRDVKHPRKVRYLWNETAISTLTNSVGLCAFPFVINVNRKHKTTIYTIGDSTMADRSEESQEAGWGQMLHEHLTDAIVVDNHAMSGRSSKSFITEGRWNTVLKLLQPGDYVFIQFGHNDEKADTTRHTDANTSFKDNLRRFITEAEEKGAKPVLFNSMIRRKFDENGKLTNTHGEYIKAPFEVAEEMSTPYVDAEDLSKRFIEPMGPEDSKKLFMWFPPKKQDDTHLNKYGARVISKLFLDGAAEALPELKKFIK